MILKDNKEQPLNEENARGTIWYDRRYEAVHLLVFSEDTEKWGFVLLSFAQNSPHSFRPESTVARGFSSFDTLTEHLAKFHEQFYCIGRVEDLDLESFVVEQQTEKKHDG